MDVLTRPVTAPAARQPLVNRLMVRLLQSRLHPLASRAVTVLRVVGSRSGATHTFPVQYARDGAALVLLAGRAETKQWWRNFRSNHPVEVCLDGAWQRGVGRALLAGTDPDAHAAALASYRRRFPRTVRLSPAARDLVFVRVQLEN